MNRRDYDTLVRFVKGLPRDGRYTQEFVMDRLAGELTHDNSNFDYDKFVVACGFKSKQLKPAKEL